MKLNKDKIMNFFLNNIKLIIIPLIMVIVSCSNTKKITENDCKQEVTKMLLAIKNRQYDVLLDIINNNKEVKNRKIVASDLEKEFHILSTSLENIEIEKDLKFSTYKEGRTDDEIFNLTITSIDKKDKVELFECLYYYGKSGKYYELSQFYTKLNSKALKAIDFISTPPQPPR